MAKTASEMRRKGWPDEEMAGYRPWQAIKRYEQDQRLSIKRERALEIARKAATELKERFGASRVVLFGSLVHRKWFTPRSDIDLLVDGLALETFSRAEATLESLTSEFKVDLVDPRECSPELLSRIQQQGLEL